MYQDDFMRRAIQISAQALEQAGTEPFGALVVKNGKIVGEGVNRSLANLDPTSHGETEAIRDACRNLGTVDLRGCELYTSCEPCALCVAAMQIAGIARLYYAADLATANGALGELPTTARFPIDAANLREQCGRPIAQRSMPCEQARQDEAVEVIVTWVEKARSAQRK